MQRFVEADYYELDWYYEECADGKTRQSIAEIMMNNQIYVVGERGNK